MKIDNSHSGFNGKDVRRGVSLFDCMVLAVLLLMILLAGSCTSTKQVSKTTSTVDSSYIKELEETKRVLTSEISRLSSELHEALFNSVEFDSTQCPPTQIIIDERCNVDSIRAILAADYINEVKIHADGTIEAKGQLRRASASLQKMQRFIAEQSKTIDSLKAVKSKETVRTVTKTEVKDKYVKRSFMTGWWMWLLFFLAGVFVRGRYNRFFNLKNKL